MQTLVYTAALSSGLLLTCVAPNQEARHGTDLAQFQGTWRLKALVFAGEEIPPEELTVFKLIIKDRVLKSLLFKEFGDVELLSLRLDPTTMPKLLDLVDWEKDFTATDDLLECIYELTGDTLRICLNLQSNRPAKGNRPTTFTSKPGMETLLMTWQREKP